MMKSRIIRVVLVVAALGGLGYWAFRSRPVPADFAAVARGTLEVTVEEEGRTRVRDRYVVSAPLPGRMHRIELDPGDPVIARKTVVARFQPAEPALLDARTRAELEARVSTAEAALDGARADRERIRTELPFAQAQLKRAQQLVKDRVISPAELEGAERQVQTLERSIQSGTFAVRAAEHQLEQARASLLQTRGGRAGALIPLYSPVDGVILRRLQESEAVVPTGQPLVEIGDLDDLEIVSDLLSSAAVAVSPGDPVQIEQWGGEYALAGRVRLIEPSGFTKISALGVEEQRVNVIVDFSDPREKWKSIGDGYRVELRIVVWRKHDVVKVPTSSLFRHEADWAVYRIEGDRAVLQIVEIGQRNGLEAEVLKGLSAGDRIVVYPSEAIGDGVEVTPRS
jgi:HlyD family secretion protein